MTISEPAPEGDETTSSPIVYCSFCGKSQEDVVKQIAGPKVAICNECVELCIDILHEEKALKVRNGLLEVEQRLNAFCTSYNLTSTLGLIGSMAWVLGVDIDVKLTRHDTCEPKDEAHDEQ